METVNVVVTLPLPAPLIEKLADVSPILKLIQREAHTAGELAEFFDEMDVLYTSQVLPDPEEAPRLRWVQLHSAGADGVLEHPLYTHSEVMFTTTSGIHAIQMAEYVMAQILALAHRLPKMLEDQAAAVWTKTRWDTYVPDEIYGATLGLVGYGSIGRQIAHVAQAFGMRVLVIKRDARRLDSARYLLPGIGDPQGEIPDRVYPTEALRSFAKECDYVAVTVPLNAHTRHLIDASVLEAMKPGAVLINVGRGDVVDEAALIPALQSGHLGGAALDVFAEEPLPPDSPLWTLPNVILSPHVSGFSPHYDERATDVFAENLRRFVVGEPLVNLVDRQLDY